MDIDETALTEAAHALCRTPAFREAVWRLHPDRAAGANVAPPSLTIHPDDQMLRHSLRGWREVNPSLSQYYNVALQQYYAARQTLQRLFGEKLDDLAVLDFACGYGRLLRFLSRTLPPSRIWASDIQRGAVDFVAAEFGVHGVNSSADPDEFRPGRTFDFIWVASLFSHLPEALFRAWVAKLVSLLSPRGVLAFSVHDERLLARGVAMPEQGIHFVGTSEIEELDSRVYGTSFVRESSLSDAKAAPCRRAGHVGAGEGLRHGAHLRHDPCSCRFGRLSVDAQESHPHRGHYLRPDRCPGSIATPSGIP